MVTGAVVAVVVLVVVRRVSRPQGLVGDTEDRRFQTLVGWEQDRVMACAKGIASSSAGFLAAVVTALLKPEVRAPSVVAVVGCVSGAVGLLLLAALLSYDARSFVRSAFGFQDAE